MKNRIIKEEQLKLNEYRERYFKQATSTGPADRETAEQAARDMAKIAGVKIHSVEWVSSPKEAVALYKSLSVSSSDSLCASLWDSISDSLGVSLSVSICDSLCASLCASLWYLFRDSISDSIRSSLRYSLIDSLWDTGWIAYFSFSVNVLGVEIDDAKHTQLDLYNKILKSCFAVWIVPGTAIICERPKTVKIENGALIGMAWRESVGG